MESKRILKNWILMNVDNPYATLKVKFDLAKETSLTCVQVENWLKYTRKTRWFRKLLLEESKKNESVCKQTSIFTKKLLSKINE